MPRPRNPLFEEDDPDGENERRRRDRLASEVVERGVRQGRLRRCACGLAATPEALEKGSCLDCRRKEEARLLAAERAKARPDKSLIFGMRDDGWSFARIARHYGLTRQAVQSWARRNEAKKPNPEEDDERERKEEDDRAGGVQDAP